MKSLCVRCFVAGANHQFNIQKKQDAKDPNGRPIPFFHNKDIKVIIEEIIKNRKPQSKPIKLIWADEVDDNG